MSDEERKEEANISPQPAAEQKSAELSEEELKKVAGGSVTLSFTKVEYKNTPMDP